MNSSNAYTYKRLILLRGLPGSGKSTFASFLLDNLDIARPIFGDGLVSVREADHFFYDAEGNYDFDINKLHQAHKTCQQNVEKDMQEEQAVIIVSNTSTTEKELEPYITLAEKYEYEVTSLVLENRHNSNSIHDVPEETLTKMRERFSVKL